MISELILGIIIIALLFEIGYLQKIMSEERKNWTKSMMAKTLREVTDNEIMEKTPPPTDAPPAEFIPLNADDDVLFDKHIKAELDAAKSEYEKE